MKKLKNIWNWIESQEFLAYRVGRHRRRFGLSASREDGLEITLIAFHRPYSIAVISEECGTFTLALDIAGLELVMQDSRFEPSVMYNIIGGTAARNETGELFVNYANRPHPFPVNDSLGHEVRTDDTISLLLMEAGDRTKVIEMYEHITDERSVPCVAC